MRLEFDEFCKYDLSEELVEDYQPMDEKMIKLLKWLKGKKNIIQGIIATTSAFLAFKGIISPEDATYINAMSLIFFGSASVATGRYIDNN